MSDDFDFDLDDEMDDLDFGEFDLDPSSPIGDERSPAGKVVTGAMDSILSENSARVAFQAVKENALPRGYATALDGVGEAVDFGNDVIEEVTKELKPAKEAAQKAIRDHSATIEKVLPKWATSRIVRMGGSDPTEREEIDPREASIAASLNAIFDRQKESAEQDIAASEQKLSTAKFKTDVSLQSSMARSLDRLASFQDTVGIDFQRKSLELQHRQFFLAKDLLDVTKVTAATQNKFLESIQHNSSLPDIVKTRNSEEFAYMAQQNLFGRVQEGFHDYAANATEKFRENLKNKITGWAGSVNTGVMQGLGLMEQMTSSGDQMAEMGIDGHEMAGGIAGDAVASAAASFASRFLGSRLRTQNTDERMEGLVQLITQGRNATRKQTDIIRSRLREAYQNNEAITLDTFRDMDFDDIKDRNEFKELVSDDRGMFNSRERGFNRAVSKYLESTEFGEGNKFSDFGERVEDAFVNKDAMVNEWAKGERSIADLLKDRFNLNTDGMTAKSLGAVEKFMRTMMPTWEEDYRIEDRLAKDAHQATTMTLLMQRSVTDIIPSYLSRMLQQLTTIATGSEAPRLEYSVEREMMVESSVKDKDALKRILPTERIDGRLRDAGELVNDLFANTPLMDNEREQLVKRILRMRDQGKSFSIDALRETKHERETQHGAASLDKLIANANLNYNDQNRVKYSSQFGRVDNLSDHLNLELSRSTAMGERDSLYRLGIIDPNTNKIDKRALLDYMDGTRRQSEQGDIRKLGDAGWTPDPSNAKVSSPKAFAGLPSKRKAQEILGQRKEETKSTFDHRLWIKDLRDYLTEGDVTYRGIPVYVTGGALGGSDVPSPMGPVDLSEASLARIESALTERAIKDAVDEIHRPSIAERALDKTAEAWSNFSLRDTYSQVKKGALGVYDDLRGNREAYLRQVLQLGEDAYGKALKGKDFVIDKGEEAYLHALYGVDYAGEKYEEFKGDALDGIESLKNSDLLDTEKLKALPDEWIEKIPDSNIRERIRMLRRETAMAGSDASSALKEKAQAAWADLTSNIAKFKMQFEQRYDYAMPGGGSLGAPVEEPAPFMGPSSQMDRLIDINDKGFSTVSQILNAMSINAVGSITFGPIGDMAASAKDGISKIYGGMSRTIGAYYRGLGSAASNALDAGKKLAGAGLGWVRDSAPMEDIYVKGRPGAVLSARLMKGDNYFDQATGNAIHSLSDIAGPVVDVDGRVVLTIEDIEMGLVDRKGRLLEGADGVRTKAWETIKSVWGFQASLASRVASIPLSLYQKVDERIKGLRNAYVKGEAQPRILATVMRNGGYFSQKTGEPVTSWDAIDGPLVDITGEVVLSLDDLQRGLVDRFGVSIDTASVVGYAASLYGGVMKKGLELSSSYLKTVKEVAVGSFDWVAKRLGDGYRTFRGQLPKDVEFLKSLYYRLKEEGLTLADFASVDELKAMFPDLDWKSFKGTTLEAVGSGWSKIKDTAGAAMSDFHLSGVVGAGQLLPVQLEQLAVQRAIYEYLSGTEWDRQGTMELEKRYAKTILPEAQEKIDNNASPEEKQDKKNSLDLLKTYRRDLKMQTSSEEVPKRETAEAVKEKKEEEKSSGLLAAIIGLGGTILGGLSTLGKGVIGSIGTLAKVLGAGKAIKDLGGFGGPDIDLPDSQKSPKKGPKPKGAVGKLWSLAKGAGSMLWKGTKGAGRLALGAGRLAWMGGSAAAAVVSWPVVLGATTAAAVGYGAYKGYNYLKLNRDVGTLEALRLMQAGVDVGDKDFVVAVRKVEARLMDDIEWAGGRPKFTGEVSEYAKDFTDEMGMDSTLENDLVQWATWFSKRFVPVMLTHLTVTKSMGIDLEALEEMPKEKVPEYVKRCRVTQEDRRSGYDPYAWTASPMGDRVVRSMLEEVTRYEDKLIASYSEGKEVSKGVAKELAAAVASKQVLEKAANKKVDLKATLEPRGNADPAKPKMAEASFLTKALAVVTAPALAAYIVGKGIKQFLNKTDLNEGVIGDYEQLRLMQYGVQKGRDQLANQVRRLEIACFEDVEMLSDTVRLPYGAEYYFRKVGAGMGLDLSSASDLENWTAWFSYRFRPIFLSYVDWINKRAKGTPIGALEALLVGKLAEHYLNETHFTQQSGPGEPRPIDVSASPMPKEVLVTDQSIIDAYRSELLSKLGIKNKDTAQKALPMKPSGEKVVATAPETKGNSVGHFANQKASTVTTKTSRFNPVTQNVSETLVTRHAEGPGEMSVKTNGSGYVRTVRELSNHTFAVVLTNDEGRVKTISGLTELDDWVKEDAEYVEGMTVGFKKRQSMVSTESQSKLGQLIEKARKEIADEKVANGEELPDEMVKVTSEKPRSPEPAPVRKPKGLDTTGPDGGTDKTLVALERHHAEAQGTRKDILKVLTDTQSDIKDLLGSLELQMMEEDTSPSFFKRKAPEAVKTEAPTPSRATSGNSVRQQGTTLDRSRRVIDSSY